MNVTALLDAPCDPGLPSIRPSANETTDPAFANVMSHYRGDGNHSLTPGSAARCGRGDTAPTDEPGANEATA